MDQTVLRDLLEALFVVAVGGMVVSVLGRLRRGQIDVVVCASCRRPCSNAYPRCRHCGAPRPDPGTDPGSDRSHNSSDHS